MRVSSVLFLLFVCHVGAVRKPHIRWKAIDGFNKFRSKAAAGKLNVIIHKAASHSLDEEDIEGSDELNKLNKEKSEKLLAMKVGPMANVKKLVWDKMLEKEANETGHKCPQSGGRVGKKHREFSLYYTPSEEQNDLSEMIQETLEDMTPWMKDLAPPQSNETMYFYVGGEFFWATRERIGCANVTCHSGKTNITRVLLQCHLAPGNLLEGMPYIAGKPCSKCDPGYSCDDNLCAPTGSIKPKGETSRSDAGIISFKFPVYFALFCLIVTFDLD